MKRRAGFAFAVFVVCAAALMFAAACDPDGLESKAPKPMSDYLEETTDAFVSALAGSAEDGRITDPSGADVTAECLTSLRVGSATASGSSVTVELAEILKDPVPVYVNAVFPEAGTYNVQLSLKKEGAWSAVTVVITAVAA